MKLLLVIYKECFLQEIRGLISDFDKRFKKCLSSEEPFLLSKVVHGFHVCSTTQGA
jgi:hypothetical protein